MADADFVTELATHGVVRLIGGAGTGKTSLLVDAAATRIATGADPESVLLLCGSAGAAARTRTALRASLRASGNQPVIGEPMVRSVHSYAFAVLRLAAQRAGDPPPRLVTGSEQDGVIRDLLAGDLADGDKAVVKWPVSLRPALSTGGFATQLRDMLARCTERGIDGIALQRIGRSRARPEWVAAGQFAQQYEQVMLLRAATGAAAPQSTVPVLGAADLIGAALEAFATDPDLLAAEWERVRVLLVDDAQHLDPQAAVLVRTLSRGADVTIVAGDPDQTVFAYRGADPALLRGEGDGCTTLTLKRSRRCAPAVARLVSEVAARLPGPSGHGIEGSGDDAGLTSARIAASEHAEAALIADALRRAHLVDGLLWSQMAVIVRSLTRASVVLPRVLAAAGVPVANASSTTALAERPAVQALLTALGTAEAPLTAEQAVALVTGPIGRVDPVALRQLRRTVSRTESGGITTGFGDRLVDVLAGELPVDLPGPAVRPLRRVRAVLAAAQNAAGHDPRLALWQVWSRSGLGRRWLKASARCGTAGAQAERDLESVTALFDVANAYVSRTSGATVGGLVEHVRAMSLAPPPLEPLVAPEAVAVLSAHEAAGREWDFVVIAGLQEGLWPNTAPRDGILGAQQLLDVLDGMPDTASRRAPVLADERRLLVAALGRARRRVLVTAVDGEAGSRDPSGAAVMPSEFFAELAGLVEDNDPVPVAAPPVLSPAALVGRLRAVVCAPPGAVDDDRRHCAATQLARLAAAGVPGADPSGWYGIWPVSTAAPLAEAEPVTVSPSTVQTIADCPLRWLLERHGGEDKRDVRSALGSVVHALIATGRPADQLIADLESVWAALPFDAKWYARNELARHRAMLETFADWRVQTRHEYREVGTEIAVDGVLRSDDPQVPDVRVRGRIDRLERDGAGRLVVVDVKTGKSPVSKDDAQRHAQLAVYQLAVAAGLVRAGGCDPAPDETVPGGGRLVYIARSNAGGAAEREQDALTPEAQDEWRHTVHGAAAAASGSVFVARANDGCSHCPVRSSCPVREGRR